MDLRQLESILFHRGWDDRITNKCKTRKWRVRGGTIGARHCHMLRSTNNREGPRQFAQRIRQAQLQAYLDLHGRGLGVRITALGGGRIVTHTQTSMFNTHTDAVMYVKLSADCFFDCYIKLDGYLPTCTKLRVLNLWYISRFARWESGRRPVDRPRPAPSPGWSVYKHICTPHTTYSVVRVPSTYLIHTFLASMYCSAPKRLKIGSRPIAALPRQQQ